MASFDGIESMANPRHTIAKVERVLDHGAGVYSVWLEPAQPLVRFKVGQFLHLALDTFSPESGYWPESRVFSIASPPGTRLLRIVYSVKGAYTSRMSRELADGKNVWLKYPFGDFIVDARKPEQTCVLVAGGTGISPFIGLLQANDVGLQKVWLYYGARKPDLLIFTEELDEATRSAGLNLSLFAEHVGNAHFPGRPINAGGLDIDAIVAAHGTERSVDYYLSGPPGMINAFKSRLIARAVPPQNIHIDAWE
jgi:ferredoxin-NADP reductase